VGVPVAIERAAAQVAWTASVVALAIFANAVASNVRDAEVAAARFGTRAALQVARGAAAAGVLVGVLAPADIRSLVAVPLATLIVLVPFRRSERYGLIVVDGALLVGALASVTIALR
jgi:hypothetical protein